MARTLLSPFLFALLDGSFCVFRFNGAFTGECYGYKSDPIDFHPHTSRFGNKVLDVSENRIRFGFAATQDAWPNFALEPFVEDFETLTDEQMYALKSRLQIQKEMVFDPTYRYYKWNEVDGNWYYSKKITEATPGNVAYSFEGCPTLLSIVNKICSTIKVTLDDTKGFYFSDSPYIADGTLYISSLGMRVKINEDVPGVMAWNNVVYVGHFSGEARSYFEKESNWNMKTLGGDASGFFSNLPSDMLRTWRPLNGPWDIINEVKGKIVESTERVELGKYTAPLRVFTVDVQEYHGRIDYDAMNDYYSSAFNLVEAKAHTRDMSFWEANVSLDFSYGDITEVSQSLTRGFDYNGLEIAKRYNKLRKKACKTENFLETLYRPGETWQLIQERVQAFDSVRILMGETGSSEFGNWLAMSNFQMVALNAMTISGKGTQQIDINILTSEQSFHLTYDKTSDMNVDGTAANDAFCAKLAEIIERVSFPAKEKSELEELFLTEINSHYTANGLEAISIAALTDELLVTTSENEDTRQTTAAKTGVVRAGGGRLKHSLHTATNDSTLLFLARNASQFRTTALALPKVIELTMSPQAISKLSTFYIATQNEAWYQFNEM